MSEIRRRIDRLEKASNYRSKVVIEWHWDMPENVPDDVIVFTWPEEDDDERPKTAD